MDYIGGQPIDPFQLICASQSIAATAGTQGEAGEETHAESDGPVHRRAAHYSPVQLLSFVSGLHGVIGVVMSV